MVGYRAIGGNTQVPYLWGIFWGIFEKVDKTAIIFGVCEDGFAASATVLDMIARIGVLYPQGSGYGDFDNNKHN